MLCFVAYLFICFFVSFFLSFFLSFFQARPTSAAFTAQLFDSVHGIALALSDLVNKKVISRSTDVNTVRDKLYEKLMTFNDRSSGYPSTTGTNNVMYFDQNQDGPPLYDIVNLVVRQANVKGWYRLLENIGTTSRFLQIHVRR